MTTSPPKESRSRFDIGQENLASLDRYLTSLRKEGKSLPERGGKVSASAVALACGVDRQSLYKNPACRAMLEAAARELGLAPMESRDAGASTKDDAKDRRISVLEQRCAVLQAEVDGLRSQLRRFAHIEEHMISTGRRVIP